MRPFLLVWNPAQEVLQQRLLDHLDTRPEIKNYFVPFLGTILIIAAPGQTPSSLSHLVHARFPSLLLAVTPADEWSTNGWMPKVFWDLIREPKSSGRWDPKPPPALPNSTSLEDLFGLKPKK